MSDHELIETAKDETKHSLWTIKEDDPTLLRLYIEAALTSDELIR